MLHGWIGSSDSIRERAEGENFQPFHFLHIIFLIRHFDKKRYRIPGLIMVPVFFIAFLKNENHKNSLPYALRSFGLMKEETIWLRK